MLSHNAHKVAQYYEQTQDTTSSSLLAMTYKPTKRGVTLSQNPAISNPSRPVSRGGNGQLKCQA
jgi:hypothetical protein